MHTSLLVDHGKRFRNLRTHTCKLCFLHRHLCNILFQSQWIIHPMSPFYHI